MATGRYARILAQNILRRLEELDLTRLELSRRSGVSISFVSDLTRDRANPSLRILEDLAAVLDISVPLLLMESEPLPPGWERVSVVLPTDQAALVRSWEAAADREPPKRAPGARRRARPSQTRS